MKEVKEKKRDWDDSKLSGFFDEGTEIVGELKFKGAFRINGFFKGKINSADMLIIGEQGHVDAEVRVGYAVVNGEFRGQIFGEEKVEIHDRGRVFGTITSPKLVIAEGAYLEAKCQTTDSAVVEETEPKDL
jgi:cytoskeletal protein CcmA (bactofilin family)